MAAVWGVFGGLGGVGREQGLDSWALGIDKEGREAWCPAPPLPVRTHIGACRDGEGRGPGQVQLGRGHVVHHRIAACIHGMGEEEWGSCCPPASGPEVQACVHGDRACMCVREQLGRAGITHVGGLSSTAAAWGVPAPKLGCAACASWHASHVRVCAWGGSSPPSVPSAAMILAGRPLPPSPGCGACEGGRVGRSSCLRVGMHTHACVLLCTGANAAAHIELL